MGRIKKFNKGYYHRRKTTNTNACTPESNPSTSKNDNVECMSTPSSASKKKLNYIEQNDENFSVDFNFNSSGFIIVNLDMLTRLVQSFVKCKNCDSLKSIEVCEKIDSRRGLASKIYLNCKVCEKNASSMTSKLVSGNYEVNLRFAYALRCIGRGQKAAQTFCGLMNLPPPPTKFLPLYRTILEPLKEVCEVSMKSAAEEAVILNNNCKDITAAFDASWQKRGHTSLNGVITGTALDNGKVIDVECLTKFCKNCNSGVEHECAKNYEGYSGGMECEGVLTMYKRSEDFHNGVRYINYLGDGDSKGFLKVSGSNVYGHDIKISKMECCGHVQKRMGARLRKLRKEKKNVKLSDGKPLSGRGRLTDAEINLLQNYYGQSIRRHAGENNVDMMRKDIWATYFHKLSKDDKPQHGLCPKGVDSWCGFQKAAATGTTYTHKHCLPEAVMLQIKPIFRDLSDRNLLNRCLHGRTQNPNESFNHCIWARIPKTVFVGIETLKFGVLDSVICFNDGTMKRGEVFRKIGLEPGNNFQSAFRKIDRQRIIEAEKHVEVLSKQARLTMRAQKRKREDEESERCEEYGPGMF